MRKELSDKCLDPVDQAKFEDDSIKSHIDYIARNSNIVLTRDQVGGYGQLMGELYCARICEYKDNCAEGVRLIELYKDN